MAQEFLDPIANCIESVGSQSDIHRQTNQSFTLGGSVSIGTMKSSKLFSSRTRMQGNIVKWRSDIKGTHVGNEFCSCREFVHLKVEEVPVGLAVRGNRLHFDHAPSFKIFEVLAVEFAYAKPLLGYLRR